VKALVFGDPPDPAEKRPTPRDEFEEKLLTTPFGLHEMADPRPIRPDWVLTRPILAGICGSDSKLVLGDFSEGDIDNPMAAFSSLPHVPGHEVVARVVELGPQAQGLEVGQRVVLNPWLTCGPRGIDPPCPACVAGDLSLCWSFTKGSISPGVHIGVTTDVPGAWAELMTAQDSMLIPVPDDVPDELAVLADPFAVSMHAVIHHPPPSGGRALVYGAGALGATTVAVLRTLYPETEIAVVARFEAQAEFASRLGAAKVVPHEPRLGIVEELAAWSGAVLHTPFDGLPMAHPGHIDVVYDTIARPETLEVGVRLLAERGTLVESGVHTPGRWEWTPLYFKELNIAGSNAFGVEEVEGVRKHAIAHYLDMASSGRVDLSGMLTHRFALEDWWDAMQAIAHQETSGAIKVAFEPSGGT
jgi:threonine dehydrogenase-like Zn-dependent dehydrogenase